MSLLDDVSIVVTPNGYKAGELYAVIPSDGAADMDVTRATAATRVDENGLVNYAEVIGGEEVIDGSFPYPNTVWGGDASTVFAEGSATLTGVGAYKNLLTQTTILESGKLYEVTYTSDLSSVTSGSLKLQDFSDSSALRTVLDGTNTIQLTANGTTFKISEGGMNGTAIFKNISVKEVTRDNVPRIDYTGGGCPHILAEPQRTNLITYSEDFSQSFWNQTTATVTVTTNTNPSGASGTYSVENVGSGSQLGASFSITSGNDYTASWYVRNISGTGAIIIKDTNNLTNNFTATSEWQRFSVTANASSGTGRCYMQVASGDKVEVWAAQFEEGSYPTSYIPNFGTALGVTRNQDIFTRDGIGSLINSTEGVLFVELSKPVINAGTHSLISLNNNASNSDANGVVIGFDNDGSFFIRLKSAGTTIFQDNSTSSVVNTFYKVAISYKSGVSLIYIDGSPITPSSGSLSNSFTFAATLDNLSFDYNGNNGLPFYGNVRQLQVYDTALSPTQLDALTS
jgi:hypothetical protein